MFWPKGHLAILRIVQHLRLLVCLLLRILEYHVIPYHFSLNMIKKITTITCVNSASFSLVIGKFLVSRFSLCQQLRSQSARLQYYSGVSLLKVLQYCNCDCFSHQLRISYHSASRALPAALNTDAPDAAPERQGGRRREPRLAPGL